MQQLGSHSWPAVSRCKAMDAEREGRISLPMLACYARYATAAASQPPNLEDAATPLPAANTLDAANSSRSSAILCPGPAAVSVGRHAAILAPHSTAVVRPSD